jgi:MFS family permease
VKHGTSHYKWVALSNTTIGMLAAVINSSILIIALPAIFRGLKLDPLTPGNVSYLLWLLMGYMLVTAVFVVTFGRLGDIYGRTKIYNLGFVVFTVGAVGCALLPNGGSAGALELIGWRVVQGIGGAMVMANSTAILTDAFPTEQRGFALGINQVAGLAGSFLGLILGGLLADWDWRAVFWVSVPIGLIGTIWGYKSLHDVKGAGSEHEHLDIWGNITFAVGLVAVLTGITYGIQPHGGHTQGWESPFVLTCLIGGVIVLAAFAMIEKRVRQPMFDEHLFTIKAFTAGNIASLLASIARGGLQFMLIIWLQGIWLPLHGYNYEDTPLWAGIYLVPLTIGFLVAGPISGYFSDRFGARAFATGGLLITALTFLGLIFLPINFNYPLFATLLAFNGIGMGLCSGFLIVAPASMKPIGCECFNRFNVLATRRTDMALGSAWPLPKAFSTPPIQRWRSMTRRAAAARLQSPFPSHEPGARCRRRSRLAENAGGQLECARLRDAHCAHRRAGHLRCNARTPRHRGG